MSLSRNLIALAAVATTLKLAFNPLKHVLTLHLTGSSNLSGWIVFVTAAIILARSVLTTFESQLKFIWHCFFAPIGKAEQRERLDRFYQGQAHIYDATRNKLLRGRKTMLNLSAGHLSQLRSNNPEKRLVWVDIGGGTGWNIEAMDAFRPISSFDAVYLIDLCEPLLQVARKRFAARGWKNVHVLCQDATGFTLPEWDGGKDPKGSVGFVTMSYALSMIPNFYNLIDRIDYVLSPQDGLLSVVDFYTSGRQASLHEKAIGGPMKECGWISRWFWQIWFDFDHVFLNPQRRDYLEYKFGTIKSYNGRNRFILPFIVRIPYYIWLGRSRSCDVSHFTHAFEVEGGNIIGNTSPRALKALTAAQSSLPNESTPTVIKAEKPPVVLQMEEEPKDVVIDVNPPLSSFHYGITKPWRLPYYEHPAHKEFRTFIYSFTWEDPSEDMKHFDLTHDDTMFVITSAGDNALHYAISAQPKRIHCVDMNPCQGHLMELKLAGIQALGFEDFFAMFGKGYQPAFRKLLDAKLAPLLSSIAYQFWRINSHMFTTAPPHSFYMQGYSGVALRIAKLVFRLFGVTKDVERLCEAKTIEEQQKIWKEKLLPVILNPLVVAVLRTPAFCWNALGVPKWQRKMFLSEGTAYDYVKDTFNPVASRALLKDGAYHYLLCLLGHYTESSCPSYLTREGYDILHANNSAAMNAFRLHTDSIVNVLRGLEPSSITRAVLMDHLDWFEPSSKDTQVEVACLHRAMAQGGLVLLRSASKKPWYLDVFARAGFECTRLAVREGDKEAIDNVNMYASFWRAVKV